MNEPVAGAFLGNVLGITDRWVRELTNKGILVKVAYGKYDLAASVQRYISHIRESEAAESGGCPAEGTSRELWEAERARREKLLNDERERMLCQTSDATAAVDHIAGMISTFLAGLPARLSSDPHEQRQIEGVIDAARDDLALRLEQASAALREGRDPLETDAADAA